MAAIIDFFKKQPFLMACLVFVVGFLVGWWGMGWGLWPVEYTGGDLSQLRGDYQQKYVRVVAEAYAADRDSALAAERIKELGPNAAKIVSDTVASSTGAEGINVAQLQVVLASTLTPATPAAGGGTSLWDKVRLPLTALAVVILVGLVGGLAFWRLSGRSTSTAGASRPPVRPAGPQPAEAGLAEEAAAAGSPTSTPPVARFMTTYTLGDDAYDDSFSVDGPDGNFLGECGMGISENIGVGDPKKVTAFEVWLFDKNDIRTVTRVVMSEHAFRDEALKSKLAAKGEPIMAKAGDTVSLETATLIVTARIVDMAYGGGALPPNSFFERLTIELAAYRKPEAAPAAAAAPAA